MKRRTVTPKKSQAVYTTIRIWPETRQMLRRAAKGSGRRMVEVLHRLLLKELARQARRET